MSKRNAGFTLIELLVVIGILGILLAIVLIAINPGRQFALANNTKRQSDVSTILNAVSQYMADNKGKLPVGMGTLGTAMAATEIAGNGTPANGDVCGALVTKFVAQLPYDPSLTGSFTSCASYDTGYQVAVDTAGRVTVSASNAQPIDEVGVTISVTR